MPSKSAYKKGIYARRMTPSEIKALGAMPVLDIDGEIAYQRIIINRLGQVIESGGLSADGSGTLSDKTISAIRLHNEAMGRLVTLLRLRDALKQDEAEARAEIERGKMLGRQKMHVFDYFKPPEEPPQAMESQAGQGRKRKLPRLRRRKPSKRPAASTRAPRQKTIPSGDEGHDA